MQNAWLNPKTESQMKMRIFITHLTYYFFYSVYKTNLLMGSCNTSTLSWGICSWNIYSHLWKPRLSIIADFSSYSQAEQYQQYLLRCFTLLVSLSKKKSLLKLWEICYCNFCLSTVSLVVNKKKPQPRHVRWLTPLLCQQLLWLQQLPAHKNLNGCPTIQTKGFPASPWAKINHCKPFPACYTGKLNFDEVTLIYYIKETQY